MASKQMMMIMPPAHTKHSCAFLTLSYKDLEGKQMCVVAFEHIKYSYRIYIGYILCPLLLSVLNTHSYFDFVYLYYTNEVSNQFQTYPASI